MLSDDSEYDDTSSSGSDMDEDEANLETSGKCHCK